MAGVTPFLMFEGRAEEAMRFYAEVVPRSEITQLERYGSDGPGPEGTVSAGRLVLDGLEVMFYDSFMHHDFTFTPSVSLFVHCESADEVDRLADALSAGGSVLMPTGDYGFSKRFAWVTDRFGVSWQVNAA